MSEPFFNDASSPFLNLTPGELSGTNVSGPEVDSYDDITPVAPYEFFAPDQVIPEGAPLLVLEGIAYDHSAVTSLAGASFWEIPEAVPAVAQTWRGGEPMGRAYVKRLNNGNLKARVEVTDPAQLVGKPYLSVLVSLPNVSSQDQTETMMDGILDSVAAFDPTGSVVLPGHSRYRILDPRQHVDCPELFASYRRLYNRELDRWEWRHEDDTASRERV